MKNSCRWLKLNRPRLTAACMLIVFAMGYELIFATLRGKEVIPNCIFRSTIGIPCPGCGMAHSSLAFFEGKFIESLKHHPLGIPFHLMMALIIPFTMVDFVKNKSVVLNTLKKPWPKYWHYSLLAILLIHWIIQLIFN